MHIHPQCTVLRDHHLGIGQVHIEIRGNLAGGGFEYIGIAQGNSHQADLLAKLESMCGPKTQTARIAHYQVRAEGFGLAILEAMATAKPVIATRSGGPEDIIEDQHLRPPGCRCGPCRGCRSVHDDTEGDVF
jgi:Glycosyl transferases group 1